MKKDVKTNSQVDEEKKDKWRRRIMMIIIIILIILSLITSCSCTSGFWGKIGDIFKTESKYPIDGTDEPEVITNKYLKFDTDMLEISLSDAKAKLSYTYENIIPKNLTCSTDDATVATCYVEDGYVVINPKKEGTVKVSLRGESNRKIYEATATVIVTPGEKYIKLSQQSGTINLAYAKEKNIYYTLVGLEGKVTVKSSDDSIATAVAKDGVLKITAHKKGTAHITVSLTYNGQEYSVSYKLNVINDKTVKPGDNDNQNKKDSNSKLKELSMAWHDFHFNPDTLEYRVGIRWRDKVTLKAIPQSSKAKVTYTFNGQTVNDLKNLKLNLGDNVVLITVTAEDGSQTVYKVVLNKVKSSDNYLKDLDISVGNLTPKFDKNELSYTVNVGSDINTVNLDAIPKSDKATLKYTFNGSEVPSLKGLNLNEGPNSVSITVVAEDGTERTYTVIINKDYKDVNDSSNSLLESLTGLDFTFDPYIENYIIGTSYENNPISLTAKTSDKDATVVYKLNGSIVNSLDNLDLQPGDNYITIEVTSPNGKSTTTYTILVNRGLADRSTDLLNVEVIKSTFPLNPLFDVNKLDYKVYVNPDTIRISFEVTTNIKAERVTYRYNGATVDNLYDLVVDRPVSVATITVEGTLNLETTRSRAARATARVTRTYTITIIKPDISKGDPSLKSLKADGEEILGTNTKNVDKDKNSVTLVAEPTESDAKVEFFYGTEHHVGNTFVAGNLQGGPNTVQVVVTTKDGETRSYTVTINKDKEEPPAKDEAYLTEFKINGQNILNSSTDVTVGDIESITVSATANTGSSIEYFYNGSSTPISLSELHAKLNGELKPGETTTIRVKVTNNNDSSVYRDYYATITRKDTETPPEKVDPYLENIDAPGYTLSPSYSNTNPTYTVNVGAKDTSIKLNVTERPDTTVTYSYMDANGNTKTLTKDELANLPLEVGDNVLTITVEATGGKSTYTVMIKRPELPVRKISFDQTDYTCYVEDRSCTFSYTVTDDGTATDDYNLTDISVSSAYSGVTVKSNITKSKIEIEMDPTKIKVGDGTISLGMAGVGDNQSTANIHFKTKNDHPITALDDIYNYDINFIANPSDIKENQKSVIIKTDVLFGKTTFNYGTKHGEGYDSIEICTGDNCIKIAAAGNIVVDIASKTEEGPTNISLIVTSTGQATGNDKLSVTGTAYGLPIGTPSNKTIDMNIIAKVMVYLYAENKTQKGIFREITDPSDTTNPAGPEELTATIGKDLDISNLEPFMLKDHCYSYKFMGYSKNDNLTSITEGDMDVIKDAKGNIIVPSSLITGNLRLYAYYSSEATPRNDDIVTVGFEGENIFINKEFDNKKVIYPSAHGSHLMNITNTTTGPIEVVGMTLREKQTVCIDGKGCLNMGYQIVPEDKLNLSAMPSKDANGRYKVLHSLEDGTISDTSFGTYTGLESKIFKFEDASGKGIRLEAGETVYVTLYWNWVDFDDDGPNDELDTLIGNRAAELGSQDLIYSIGVGFHYKPILEDCPTP